MRKIVLVFSLFLSSAASAEVYTCKGISDSVYLRAEVLNPLRPVNIYISESKEVEPILFLVPMKDITKYEQTEDWLYIHARRGNNPNFLNLDYDVVGDSGLLDVIDDSFTFSSRVRCVLN